MLRESILIEALHSSARTEQEPILGDDEVENALRVVRQHLGMEIGFVSEFLGEERIFRHVDSSLSDPPIRRGQRLAMDNGYCRKVVAGELPELIPDTSLLPAALEIPETRLLPIGSHLSVPVRLSDGSVYGTLCCFSSQPDHSLCIRDLQTLRAVADMVAVQVQSKAYERKEQSRLRSRIETALENNEPVVVYQPITRLSDMATIGVEALSRFTGTPLQSPDKWFADAAAVDLRAKLELAAVRNALRDHEPFWKQGWYLALNISPRTLVEQDFSTILKHYPLEKIVLELTEHERVEDYDALAVALKDLRARGLRIAVDDAGSGYASLRHVLNIRPDIIKLDISLTCGIDVDPVRQALAAAIVDFSRRVDCSVVAEGIETVSQLSLLRELGINLGQGYLIAKPMAPDDLKALQKI